MSGILDWVTGLGSLFGNLGLAGAQYGLQKKAWAREDNAVQRRVADLKKAGLSPTLAAGSAAASSAPIYASKAYDKAGESAVNALNLMSAKQDIARAATENKIKKEELKKIEMENEARSYQKMVPQPGGTYTPSGVPIYVDYLRAQMEEQGLNNERKRIDNIVAQEGIAQSRIKTELERLRADARFEGYSVSELEVLAKGLAIVAQRIENEGQGMNLNMYRATGLAPQLFGASLGVADKLARTGMYYLLP